MARLALSVIVLMMAVIALTEGLRGVGPKKCCFKFNDKPVSKERVVGYIKTSQRCPNPAILLNTVAGRQLCVRTSATWVKELINYLETKNVLGANSNM
ncbi:monocyte chemotactic protein 1B-like [Girardinichthys multiradiatus]|uniref:monocyte chemotactic protein 1B-like n=1 Tax=Girardinichthys multiradiatus TaxID=208333 RepID=UPI001FAD3048|nr:monocyte chemotactic protein 1B-like [Girardinichthys multiradiatus]